MERIDVLKKYRIEADLSWNDLAKKIGMRSEYLQIIATGTVNPGPRTKHKIERFIDSILSTTICSCGDPQCPGPPVAHGGE